MSFLPVQVFSRLLDYSHINEFIFTDSFRMFHQPFTDIQVSQACVALTSDLEITAANVTCARNHAVLFV